MATWTDWLNFHRTVLFHIASAVSWTHSHNCVPMDTSGSQLLPSRGILTKSGTWKISKYETIPVTAVEAHSVVRHRGSHIFLKVGSQMAVKLSELSAGRPPFTPRKIPDTRFCYSPSSGKLFSSRIGSRVGWFTVIHNTWNHGFTYRRPLPDIQKRFLNHRKAIILNKTAAMMAKHWKFCKNLIWRIPESRHHAIRSRRGNAGGREIQRGPKKMYNTSTHNISA
jgi:hypothetical protein